MYLWVTKLNVCGILVCMASWSSQDNTNVFDGLPDGATMLAACQEACINNAECTGVDWDPNNPDGILCWLSGPWSGPRNDYGALGVTRYDLTRCDGKSNIG